MQNAIIRWLAPTLILILGDGVNYLILTSAMLH